MNYKVMRGGVYSGQPKNHIVVLNDQNYPEKCLCSAQVIALDEIFDEYSKEITCTKCKKLMEKLNITLSK